MSTEQQQRQSIFRPDAVRRYLESSNKVVLPRLISPRIFGWLWVVVAITLLAGLLVWLPLLIHMLRGRS